MPARKLKEFLDRENVEYVAMEHSVAYTAPEVAESARVTEESFAKTVIVEIGSEMAMVVLPANRRIVLADLQEMLADQDVRLATEEDFRERFPDCEVGAMPPFGNLYGLPVYVAQAMADREEIVFNAGTHREVIRMSYSDFANLVKPTVMNFATASP